jgi:hypothetical protein
MHSNCDCVTLDRHGLALVSAHCRRQAGMDAVSDRAGSSICLRASVAV